MERTYNDTYGRFEYLWLTGLTEILYINGSRFTYVKEHEELPLSNKILIGAHNKRFILKNNGDVKIIGICAYNHGAALLFRINTNQFKRTITGLGLENIDEEKLF